MQDLQREKGCGILVENCMPFIDWIYISEETPDAFPNRLNLSDVDELIPGIARRVSSLMNIPEFSGFAQIQHEIISELQSHVLAPKDVYLTTQSRLWWPDIELPLEEFMKLVGISIPTGTVNKDVSLPQWKRKARNNTSSMRKTWFLWD